jgi:hypothetical protein
MDNTKTIFNLIITENYVTGECLGLSVGVAKYLAGGANQLANTECEFIAEVLEQAKNFQEHVQDIIDREVLPHIDFSDLDGNESSLISDLEILNSMKNWTFDTNRMETLARADWETWSTRNE